MALLSAPRGPVSHGDELIKNPTAQEGEGEEPPAHLWGGEATEAWFPVAHLVPRLTTRLSYMRRGKVRVRGVLLIVFGNTLLLKKRGHVKTAVDRRRCYGAVFERGRVGVCGRSMRRIRVNGVGRRELVVLVKT